VRDALGATDRVFHRQQTAPRVPEHHGRFEPEPVAYPIEVIDLCLCRDIVGLLSRVRPAASSLVVIDEMEAVGQSIHVG
jgi:hypothetical protein